MAGIVLGVSLLLSFLSLRHVAGFGQPTWSTDRFHTVVQWPGALLTAAGLVWFGALWLGALWLTGV